MLVAKQVADLITFSRSILGLLLVWLGIACGAAAFPLVVWIMFVDWLGNMLDGSIARRRRRRYHTWIHASAGDLPIIIGGDFNAGETSPQIARLQAQWTDTFRQAQPSGEGITHTLRGPAGSILHQGRLDYIFLHPAGWEWQVLEAHHMDGCEGPHSDHRAVLVRLALAH